MDGIIGRIADEVSRYSPILSQVLTSSNPLASKAMDLLHYLFDQPDQEKLPEAIQNDPDVKLKLAQAEHDLYSKEVEDRENARGRESNFIDKGFRDWVPTILALGFLLIYAGCQTYCILHPLSALDLISARVQDIFVMIVSYYFGASNKKVL